MKKQQLLLSFSMILICITILFSLVLAVDDNPTVSITPPSQLSSIKDKKCPVDFDFSSIDVTTPQITLLSWILSEVCTTHAQEKICDDSEVGHTARISYVQNIIKYIFDKKKNDNIDNTTSTSTSDNDNDEMVIEFKNSDLVQWLQSLMESSNPTNDTTEIVIKRPQQPLGDMITTNLMNHPYQYLYHYLPFIQIFSQIRNVMKTTHPDSVLLTDDMIIQLKPIYNDIDVITLCAVDFFEASLERYNHDTRSIGEKGDALKDYLVNNISIWYNMIITKLNEILDSLQKGKNKNILLMKTMVGILHLKYRKKPEEFMIATIDFIKGFIKVGNNNDDGNNNNNNNPFHHNSQIIKKLVSSLHGDNTNNSIESENIVATPQPST